ncbi:hypothetical protein BDR26DRAFT_931322 [Obelidium mucronatum]|nr:hypothetical protein BDR26DRAFT_931322 [Obelidium mucronatum]
MQVFVKTLVNTTVIIELGECDTVGQLKEKIYAAQLVPPDQQRLIFAGKQLCDDSATLSGVGLKDQSTVHLDNYLSQEVLNAGVLDLDDIVSESSVDEEGDVQNGTRISESLQASRQVTPFKHKPKHIKEALSLGATIVSLNKHNHGPNYTCAVKLPTSLSHTVFPNIGVGLLQELSKEFPTAAKTIRSVLKKHQEPVHQLHQSDSKDFETLEDLENGIYLLGALASRSTFQHLYFSSISNKYKVAFKGIKINMAPSASVISNGSDSDASTSIASLSSDSESDTLKGVLGGQPSKRIKRNSGGPLEFLKCESKFTPCCRVSV